MCISRRAWTLLLIVGPMLLQGCAGLQGGDPLKVTVAGIEPLQGQGMEMRMMVKLAGTESERYAGRLQRCGARHGGAGQELRQRRQR